MRIPFNTQTPYKELGLYTSPRRPINLVLNILSFRNVFWKACDLGIKLLMAKNAFVDRDTNVQNWTS